MKADITNIWIDRAGMAAIAIVTLGYVLFGSSFAQLRLQFSFLNFPIFIGEILLIFCSLLFIIKSMRQQEKVGCWGWVLGAYLFFVLFKAFSGYVVWGPLAFRDAALFYYPFFAVLGYSFWSNDLGGNKTRWLAFLVILSIFVLGQFLAFWPCSLFIMGIILALKAKNFYERVVLIGVVLIFVPYGILLNTFLRTVFLSSVITVIFIGVTFFLLFCKDRWVRIIAAVLGSLVLGMFLFKFSQTGIGRTFFINDVRPSATTLSQNPAPGKYLFHPVGSSPEKPDAIKEFLKRMSKGHFVAKKKCVVEKKCVIEKDIEKNVALEKPCVVKNEVVLTNERNITIGDKKSDTLFRYYIWRDMLEEYLWYRPLFGFDFGRPLLSPTLSKYFQVASTQGTDGWVGAHNSFFYMIYRGGIIGFVLILSLLFVWGGLLRDFYILKDWTGILLCAVILNWMVSANFFLIFELPYTAIPIWTILGITLKYRLLFKK